MADGKSLEKSAIDEEPLVFHWAPRREISLALPLFLILSLLLHAATFYIFQISYPQNVTLTPPPAEVMLLTREKSSAAFWQRTQQEDPSLLLRPISVEPPLVFPPPYQPSYLENSIAPQLVDAAARSVPMPTGRTDSSFLATSPPPLASPARAPAPPLATRVTFSPSLQNLVNLPLPALKIPKPSPQNLEPSTFYVGIRPNGAIGYVFLESSSGNPRMDRMGEEFLMALPCRRGDERVSWGFATIRWGADAMMANGNEPF